MKQLKVKEYVIFVNGKFEETITCDSDSEAETYIEEEYSPVPQIDLFRMKHVMRWDAQPNRQSDARK
ncbi:MAG TPA: hypothetical protein VMX17_09145 [Candidatus Glassbacteria bacterium]|nr:hypothetical protein [Candidatus Glassbacteria bacterium]